jgi:hypothetical protein
MAAMVSADRMAGFFGRTRHGRRHSSQNDSEMVTCETEESYIFGLQKYLIVKPGGQE